MGPVGYSVHVMVFLALVPVGYPITTGVITRLAPFDAEGRFPCTCHLHDTCSEVTEVQPPGLVHRPTLPGVPGVAAHHLTPGPSRSRHEPRL